MSILSEFGNNCDVEVIAYTLLYKGVGLDEKVIQKDLSVISKGLESSKYSIGVGKSSYMRASISFIRDSWLLRNGKGLNLSLFNCNYNLYKYDLNYGNNVPRFIELYAYIDDFKVVYFIKKTHKSVGNIEKHVVGEGVSWGSDFFWNCIA